MGLKVFTAGGSQFDGLKGETEVGPNKLFGIGAGDIPFDTEEIELTLPTKRSITKLRVESKSWRQMGSSYSNYRDSLKKKWFKQYGEVTEEARANVPLGLEKDDWNCLVDLWSKQDYMDMCLQNKENRDKNNIVHTSSSKSFQQRSAEEKEKTGHSPSRIELFDITHVQANGQVVNEPTQDALVALRNLTTQVNEGALQISQDQMFVEVFGPERHGRVRGYGARVTPTKLWGSSSSKMYDLEK
nr:uncharacterized protein LOC111997303 isoform X1 [Quercus suber]